MHDAHQLCVFFADATHDEKTAVLLEVCARDPELLLEILRNMTDNEGDWQQGAIVLLKGQQKIGAIKHCREILGCGLKEAKDKVEALQQRLGL